MGGGGNKKVRLRCNIYRMRSRKIRQYRCLLKFPVCCDNGPFEGHKQEKFGTELNCNLYCTLHAKYFFKKYLNMR